MKVTKSVIDKINAEVSTLLTEKSVKWVSFDILGVENNDLILKVYTKYNTHKYSVVELKKEEISPLLWRCFEQKRVLQELLFSIEVDPHTQKETIISNRFGLSDSKINLILEEIRFNGFPTVEESNNQPLRYTVTYSPYKMVFTIIDALSYSEYEIEKSSMTNKVVKLLWNK